MSQTILFVDDNPVNRQLLRAILSTEYSDIHEATNGLECIEIMQNRPIDLLLLDLNMPELSGFEVLTQIPTLDLISAPTTIVISADKDPSIISKVLIDGAADYITTPYNREELLARVRTHLTLRNRELHLEQLVIHRTKELTSASYRLEQVQKQLIHADKMASLGQLAAGVAHEINNPVGYIRSNLHTLQDYLEDIRKVRKQTAEIIKSHGLNDAAKEIDALEQEFDVEFLLQDIQDIISDSLKGTAQIRQIVTDLKGYSHPEQHDWQLNNIHDLIESSLNIVGNQLKYKIKLHKRYQRDLPQVYCIGSQISQILINLLVNAEQAIEKTGNITITTSLSTQSLQKNSVDICITDDGHGIDESIANRIFDPFFTTKVVGAGTGLGLSICYNIAQGHGGKISVQSNPDRGSQFTLSLPAEYVNEEDSS